MKLVSAKEAREIFKITPMTLNNWKKSGKIKFKQINPRKVLYDVESVIGPLPKQNDRINVVYARVSNTKQAEDLDKQIDIIKQYMISNGIKADRIFKDIASGMNEKRSDFNKLFDMVSENKIDKVYITFNDRLTRFGFSYFQRIFEKFGTKIVVLNATDEKDFKQELLHDMISILHHFSMKFYSNRRNQLKKITKGLYQLKASKEFQDDSDH